MKKLFALGLAMALVGVAAWAASVSADPPKKSPHVGQLRHVVLFRFKKDAKPADIKKVEDAFRELPVKIPGVLRYEWGTNVSPEPFSEGFTHCFTLTFKNGKDRDAYLVHPAHKAFGKMLGPYLDKVMVIDFVVKD
jgi:hypothetical protein